MFKRIKFRRTLKSISVCLIFIFISTMGIRDCFAQSAFIATLPEPGAMIDVSEIFTPLLVKGLVVHPDKPLNFDFIVDSGNDATDQAVIKEQTYRIAQYFLAAVTVPEKQLWVNLSPYEQDRIIENELGQTVLGRDMLAQDYVLKQLTASLIYPEKGLGKEFWSRVYAEAQAKFGTTDISVDTFNKVWIMPGKAEVFEHGSAVYVTDARLKVMLDTDRTATIENGLAEKASVGKKVFQEIVLPAIETEINSGKNFATMRQIYHAAILAKWYRELIQNTLLADVYVGKNHVNGVISNEKAQKEEIYQRYIAAYKKGVFNYIKEEPIATGETLPRKYFSGGESLFIHQLDHAETSEKVEDSTGTVFGVSLELSPLKYVPMNPEETAAEKYPRGGGGDIFDLQDPAVQAAFQKEVNVIFSKVKNAKELMMQRYSNGTVLPIHYTAFPDSQEERYYLQARKFFIKKVREGFEYPTFYNVHLMAAIYYHLEKGYSGVLPEDPEDRLIRLLKTNNILNILEVGTLGNNLFAIILNDLVRKTGGSMSIIDLSGDNVDARQYGIKTVKGDARRAGEYFEGKKFDLVISSGVLSLGGVGAMGETQDVPKIFENAFDSLSGMVNSLSANEKAAVISTGYASHLVLDRVRVSRSFDLDLWDNAFSRHSFFKLDERYFPRELQALKASGASLAIIRKKQEVGFMEDGLTKIYQKFIKDNLSISTEELRRRIREGNKRVLDSEGQVVHGRNGISLVVFLEKKSEGGFSHFKGDQSGSLFLLLNDIENTLGRDVARSTPLKDIHMSFGNYVLHSGMQISSDEEVFARNKVLERVKSKPEIIKVRFKGIYLGSSGRLAMMGYPDGETGLADGKVSQFRRYFGLETGESKFHVCVGTLFNADKVDVKKLHELIDKYKDVEFGTLTIDRVSLVKHENDLLEGAEDLLNEDLSEVSGPMAVEGDRAQLEAKIPKEGKESLNKEATKRIKRLDEGSSNKKAAFIANLEKHSLQDLLKQGQEMDRAQNGGIDIQNIGVAHKTGSTKIRFNDEAIHPVLKSGFNGFTPVIIKITPVSSPLPLLGVVQEAPLRGGA